MTRTSTLIVWLSPTRSNSRSCKRAEELCLQRAAHRPDFIEEERAFVRLFEASLARTDCASERPADMAEELRLQQGLGDRAAVQRDEPMRSPSAVVVNRPRDDLLAGPGLSGDENRAVRAGHGLEQMKQLLHRPASSENTAELVALLELGAKVGVLRA